MADLTITDPEQIRAVWEAGDMGEESLGGDSESGTYNRSNRPPAGPRPDADNPWALLPDDHPNRPKQCGGCGTKWVDAETARACERRHGDDITTPAPVGAAVALDLDAAHVRTDPACTFHDGATPKASRGKSCPACMRLDLDAMARRYSTATDDEVIYEMYPALEAEVRRLAALCIPLTDLAQELDLSRQNLHHSRAMSSAHFERAEREKARAESAEAEVVTLRAKVAAVEAHPVVLELAEERTRQTAKHGDQSHLPDGTGAALWLSMDDDYIRRHGIRRDNLAAWAKARTDEASQASGDGSITFEHILTEEWAEAIAESDPDALRAELVQVAAVAVQWIEAIDLRAALATTGEGERPKCDTCNDTGRCDWSPGEHRDTEEWDRPCIDHCDATTGEGE